MERFCIITNCDKDEDFQMTNFIKDFLEKENKTCVITYDEKHIHSGENCYTNISLIPKDTQCAIVLGGDGTIIQAANDLIQLSIPIIGINLGTLGFLAETEKHQITETLEALIEDQCRIEKRMMLEGNIICEEESSTRDFALNDIVISRSGYSRIVSVEIYVNDELVDTYLGDGVLISTPTGSTGYNLSAGGPIVTPASSAIIITPICPHALNARSIIVSSEDTIVAKIGTSKKTQTKEVIATFDGREGIRLKSGDYIIINKAEKETKLVKVNNTSFFEILRNKLGKEKEKL